jgi:hypothetical protein
LPPRRCSPPQVHALRRENEELRAALQGRGAAGAEAQLRSANEQLTQLRAALWGTSGLAVAAVLLLAATRLKSL